MNEDASGQQLDPDVAMARGGSFVVVWEDDQGGDGSYQIYAAGFDRTGQRLFSDMTVNVDASGQQRDPAVSTGPDDGFVVVWEDDSKPPSGTSQIYAAGFGASWLDRRAPTRVFDDITVNTDSSGQQLDPAVSVGGSGRFIVVWEDDRGGDGSYQIYAASFLPDGRGLHGDFTVNSKPDGQQVAPDVTAAPDGSFVAVWEDDRDKNGSFQVVARRVSLDDLEARPKCPCWFLSLDGMWSWELVNTGKQAVDFADLRAGDFNGDGIADVFHADGKDWRVSFSAKSAFERLRASTLTSAQIAVVDMGKSRAVARRDGVSDVFTESAGRWLASWGGRSDFEELNSSTESLSELAFGDFDGDATTDVFNGNGSQWRVSLSGRSRYAKLADSALRTAQLRFFDFDGDRRTDAFHADGALWRYSPGASGRFEVLQSSLFPIDSCGVPMNVESTS